ncbi:MAG TPA: hypothetical protein VJ978_13045 [Nitriliruptoraceae bacterium]|nr:hypothetical protein [Nitriliruptoraceae bacterium]
MALTDDCSIYGAVHEDGINLVLRHIMQQRPSYFNFATELFVKHPERLCVPIEPAQSVEEAANPLFRLVAPMPVLDAPRPIGLNWCFQLTEAQVDVHPLDEFGLPPEIGNLPDQHLALRFAGCLGLGCLDDAVYDEWVAIQIEEVLYKNAHAPAGDAPSPGYSTQPVEEIDVPEVGEITCFCMEVFAVLRPEWWRIGNDDSAEYHLTLHLEQLEIVDLEPDGLETIIECYVTALLRLSLLPRLTLGLRDMIFDLTGPLHAVGVGKGKKIVLQPSPPSAAVPNNPAVEDDQLKAFVDLVITP